MLFFLEVCMEESGLPDTSFDFRFVDVKGSKERRIIKELKLEILKFFISQVDPVWTGLGSRKPSQTERGWMPFFSLDDAYSKVNEKTLSHPTGAATFLYAVAELLQSKDLECAWPNSYGIRLRQGALLKYRVS